MTSAITAAPTCIHGDCHDGCHPVAIVPADVFAAARAWRRSHWHEIYGVGDGYSDAIPVGSRLHETMLAAYRAATGDAPGRLVWLRTPDYERRTWVVHDDYRAWMAQWDALETPEQRRAMRETNPMPAMGHWREQIGECLCFLTISYDGSLQFTG